MKRIGFLVLILCLPSTWAKEKFTPQHVARLRMVGSAEISPDGKHLAYTLIVPRDLSKEKDGTAWSQLHVVDLKGNSRPFISGEVKVGSIQWTDGGKKISFLTARDGDKGLSLYTIPFDGGEAQKVIGHGTSISEYSWSPDGKQIAFLATEPDSEKVEKQKEKGFTQEIYEEDNKYTRVWIAKVGSDDKPRMLKLKGSAYDLHWSPKGDQLAVALARDPLIDSRYMFRRVHLVNVESGKAVNLKNPGKLGQVSWSPDGSQLAIISAVDINDPREGRLWVTPVGEKSKWTDLTPDHKGHVSSFVWNDNKSLTYLSNDGVYTSINRVSLDGKKRNVLIPTGGPVMHHLSLADNGTLGMIGEAPKHPREVFYLGKGAKSANKLTDQNAWLKDMEFASQEVITHKAKDGLKLEGILIRPLGAKKGELYPLVLSVHGGPESHVPNGWVTTYSNLGQVGAANGMAVFYPNYRGSTGRGLKFSKMGQRDAAGKEFDDLVDAVDHLIELGLVDKSKVGITGGSYGGFATAWGSTFYSKRFAAGVMFVGISDNVSKVGTTDIPWEMYHVHHMKWLWEDWNYFLKRSPIYHIEKAQTPLLIMHGKNDPRVHPGQSMELFRHLKIRKKAPVRLVLYPGEGHGNRRAASRLDYNMRLLRWMDHFLKKGSKKAPPKQLNYGLK